MSEFCFSFLENQFRDIYLDCARMDKNLIEGDGVEAILIAGRIAEKITKAIFAFEGIKDDENSQYKRIEKLNNANILPNNIKSDFSKLRRLRNDVYHNTLNSDGTGGFKSPSQANRPYVQNGGLRDYKTGFNEVNDDSSFDEDEYQIQSTSNPLLSKGSATDIGGELQAASEAHKIIFNICVWFYVNYSGDKDFIRPKYKLSRRTQDADFLIRLKSAINDGNDFIRLRQSSPNNEIVQILNELYIPKVKEEKQDDFVYGINNKEIKIRQPDVPYSQCLGISYDDNLFMWKAEHGDKELGLYQSSKEAFEAREIYISSIPMPRKIGGAYSKSRGISFSKLQKLWTVSVKGKIISYHSTENEAVKARKDYLKSNGLVDVKVKGGYKTITIEERDRLREKAKEKVNKSNVSKPIKTIDSKSSIKDEIDKKDSKSKLDYAKEFENKNKNKVKVQDGNKVSSEKAKRKVKVSGGAKVSKSKSGSATIHKKASKYEGVYYEDGLFMWSAEVDGKHLGLFDTEEEAHKKREEYIKNRS
ncbi:hypothetical protein [Methanobrevibacter sp.]|uniref:hypothetical protein n=1 Tax=Methanobrevibacter sp. TaxID=66852 RepID=UPI0025D09496|nr:hypothetical protein [Methanobrevibacter sp.]MBQ2961744.1 hypothetical protein [Methanobrevibacter sp.]